MLQVLMSGVALGGIYTLLALGLFLTYATSRALNFGSGDFLALAAFLGMAGMLAGWPLWLLAPAVALALALLSMVLERVAVRPVVEARTTMAGHLGWILTTLGFGLIVQNAITTVWGKSRHASPPLFSSGEQQVVNVLGARLYLEEVAVAAIAFALVGAMYWLLFRSSWGRRVATVSFDPATAQLLGIDVRRTVTGVYLLTGVLTACAGLLVGPLAPVQSHMGMLYLLKAFAVISIGGFSNPLGLLVGGLAFGTAESFSNYWNSEYGDLFPFLGVIAFLVWRPMGLLGERSTDGR
jgi:branched-chain amino acid transport system permease protein